MRTVYNIDDNITIPSCITNPSITCVRTCGFTMALGGVCLLFTVIGAQIGIIDDSSPITPFVIAFTVLASPVNGLLHCFSSTFGTIASSSFVAVLHCSSSM